MLLIGIVGNVVSQCIPIIMLDSLYMEDWNSQIKKKKQ